MASYKYEIVGADGKKQKGTIEAASQDAAVSELQTGGGFVVSIAKAGALEKDINIQIGKPVKTRELSVFCRQFQSVLQAGVTVVEALEMLAGQTENKYFKRTLEEVREAVQKGDTLANAMSLHPKVFPELLIHMVSAGEASGSLEVAFDRVGKQFEKDARVSGMVVKSMIYPIILIAVIIVVVIVMMVKIVPTFTEAFDMLDGAQLPGITLAVMAVSDFLMHKWWILLGIVAAVAIFIHAFKRTEMGAYFFGKLALKLPLFGNLTIKSASANLNRTMSTLMAAGISVVDALKIVEKIVKNAIVQRALKQAQADVMEGRQLSQSLKESEVFPPMVYQMIHIGEETGSMEPMMDKISDYYEEEVENATESLMAALEPMIIIVMAIVVVPIILAIMMPMLTIQNAIGV